MPDMHAQHASADTPTPSAPLSGLQYIKGIGPKRAEALALAGLLTPRDVLNFFPRGYLDRSTVKTLREIRDSLLYNVKKQNDFFKDDIQLVGEITTIVTVKYVREDTTKSNRKLVAIELDDHTGARAEIVYWNQANYFKKVFQPDQILAVSGMPSWNSFKSTIEFHHPDIERIDPEDSEQFHAGKILPKYRLTQQMKDAGITLRTLRTLVGAVIEQELPSITESLSDEICQKYHFPSRAGAIRQLHFPDSLDKLIRARKRMKFEELFFFELLLALRQYGTKTTEQSFAMHRKSTRARQLMDALPFDLTAAQKRVLKEISADMQTTKPMNRLLQGDVGSGKTIVSLFAMFMAIDNDCQCVMMAPTEILAEQHYLTIKELVRDLNIEVVQLVGGQKTKARREVLEKISSGKAQIIVGTHAVFQSMVEYRNLGLVVVDEQHRFGVLQRAELRKKATASFAHTTSNEASATPIVPHILVMSATPIPRTLSMTLYGELDVSVIDELPKNRKPIQTKVVFENQLSTVFDFIREEITKGRQAYIVYPLVEKSEKLELKAAVDVHEQLQSEVFPDLKLGLLHGQMLWYEKEDAMKAFKNREYHILIATTVVEVGIDVPNASVMLIEHAERFGLSQLHQLRGRVGRGAEQSYCLLATKDHFRFYLNKFGSDENQSRAAIIRLRTMTETTDGFKIAEKDLELRGPGDFLGTRQSGLPDFTFTDLVNDSKAITLAREEAFALVARDPQLQLRDHQMIRTEFLRLRGNDRLGLIDIA
jgi:ATP-dependent DNA helicase RecG